MVGYLEGKYEVLEKHELKINDTNSKKIIEVRIGKENKGFFSSQSKFFLLKEKIKECLFNRKTKKYISILMYTENGVLIRDLILKYESNTKKDFNEDLMKIKTSQSLNIKDLNCNYRIEDHHIGRSKSGSVTMY